MKTKQVYPTSEISHLWANKRQESARNSGNNLFFENDNIYSYGKHFLISKHVINENRERGVLFTKRGYSNTTAKHISLVRNACNHLNIINVPDPADNKILNFEAWYRECKAIANNLIKAKKPEKYLSQLGVIDNEVNKYCNFFGYEIPIDLQTILNIGSKDEYVKFKENEQKIKEAQEKQLLKEAIKLESKKIKEFRQFKVKLLYSRATGKDFLRYNKESKRVETSQGIEIPEAIAHKFYKYIISVNKKGGCINCENKLMDYPVKEINSKFIVIGCHNVDLKEINKIAILLKW